MSFRSAWTALLLVALMAVACFGPACGVACAAKMPCHEEVAMADCTGMGQMASVQAAPSHTVTCGQDDAVVDRSDLDVHVLPGMTIVQADARLDVRREVVRMAVREVAKAPPRPVVVMRV